MFSKIWTSSAIVLALAFQVHAHAAVSPALGVNGTPVRNDVKEPNTANPCGAGVNIASSLDTSTAAAADASGSFNAQVIDFNGGADGSRKVTAKVDPTGKGTNFVAMTVTTNGDAAPTTAGTQPIVAQLPTGTKCTGGASGNKCLVQFVTTAGFGNCVVVSQGAAGASASKTTGSSAAESSAGSSNGNMSKGTGADRSAADGKQGSGGCHHDKAGGADGNKSSAAGTRAARSLLAGIKNRRESVVQMAKRGGTSWIWA